MSQSAGKVRRQEYWVLGSGPTMKTLEKLEGVRDIVPGPPQYERECPNGFFWSSPSAQDAGLCYRVRASTGVLRDDFVQYARFRVRVRAGPPIQVRQRGPAQDVGMQVGR